MSQLISDLTLASLPVNRSTVFEVEIPGSPGGSYKHTLQDVVDEVVNSTENDNVIVQAIRDLLGAGSNITLTYDGSPRKLYIAASGGSSVSHSTGATWLKGSGAVSVPVNDVAWYAKSARTITGVTVLTQGGNGSCVIDIWKKAIGSYPPTVSDSICASAKPTISGAKTYVDTTLTGWTTTVNAGDTLQFHLESTSTFTYIAIQLHFST